MTAHPHRRSGPPTARVACLAIGLLAASPALPAHDGLHQRIAAATEGLARTPDDADLLLRRAGLHRLHRDFDAALADVERADALEPGRTDALLLRGTVCLDAGWPRAARAVATRLLERHPDHAIALLLRARAGAAVGDHPGRAASDYQRAIAAMDDPQPDHFLEHARVLASVDPRAALQRLDEGLQRLGPIVSLQAEAIDLAVRLERFDEALTRLDEVMAPLARRETWLVRRAEILAAAGRSAPAAAACDEALAAIEALPPRRRRTGALDTLMERIDAVREAVRDPFDSADTPTGTPS